MSFQSIHRNKLLLVEVNTFPSPTTMIFIIRSKSSIRRGAAAAVDLLINLTIELNYNLK